MIEKTLKLLKLSLDSLALIKTKNQFHKVNYLLRKKNPLVGEKIAFVTCSMLHGNMSLPFPLCSVFCYHINFFPLGFTEHYEKYQ